MNEITQKSGQLNRLMSVEEAAEYLNVSPRTLYNRIAPKARNPFPVRPKRIGKLVRFDRGQLDQWIDSL